MGRESEFVKREVLVEPVDHFGNLFKGIFVFDHILFGTFLNSLKGNSVIFLVSQSLSASVSIMSSSTMKIFFGFPVLMGGFLANKNRKTF